ncbi:MAG: three-Cys-motif partner protein TcmP [Planctomycetota bacterium]|nr:three-Cys-motif partner protein TcmP [Planctomycetota bacterium]
MPPRKTGGALPSAYQGREQAYVKHELLKAYLEKLFLIIGMSSSRLGITELCYVDCFAGPWSAENESLSDTSIGVSLRILDKCQKQLNARGMKLRFRALYVEKDDTAFRRLETFLSECTPTGIEAEPLHGDFVALREQILSWCGTSAFAFFFIDPTGWKEVSVQVLKPLLRRRRSEFLINFMYDFVNRTASMSQWKGEIALLLGGYAEVDKLQAREREALLVNTYRSNLKRELPSSVKSKARSAYVRVLDREKQRPKYHLVYLTTHPRGIIEFMEISEDIDLVQKQVRASTKQATRAVRTGMHDMFGDEVPVDSDADRAPIAEVENYWRAYLSEGVKRIGEEEFAALLEDTNWFPGDFQRALKQLMDTKEIRNLDTPRIRPKRPLHWEKGGERLELAVNSK